MLKRILARYWEDEFQSSIYRLIPKAIPSVGDIWAAHAKMAAAPLQEQNASPHLLYCTGSYLFNVDAVISDMETETHQLHAGHAMSDRRIRELENDIKGWATRYNQATEAALRANMENQSLKHQLREAMTQKATVNDQLFQAEGDLEIVEAHLMEVEVQENQHLDTIDKLKKKILELEDQNKKLQTQVDGHQDNMTMLSHLECVNEHKFAELKNHLEENTHKITNLTFTAVCYHDLVDRTL